MMTRIITIVLLFFADDVLSYGNMYVKPDTHGVPYEKTRQEIVHNFLSNKPLLNYVPIYNTDYGHWSGVGDKSQDADRIEKSNVAPEMSKPIPASDVDFQKLGQVIIRLKTDMQALSQQTKNAYESKLRELNEVKKLNDDLKVALQNTEILRHNLYEHEKQLNELAKNLQGRHDCPQIYQSGMQEFLNMIENLEMMVRNISYKYASKTG